MLFGIFTKIVQKLVGKGLGRLPLVMRFYRFLYCLLLPEAHTATVTVQEHRMYINIGDMGDVTSDLKHKGIYHPEMTGVVKGIVKEGMVCVDVGAHIGYFTLIMAGLTSKSGRVFAFEPEPSNFDLLMGNVNLNGYNNVELVQKAVSNGNGLSRLLVDPISLSSNTLIVSLEEKGIEVSQVTLDDFFKDYPLEIGLVKIDVEGAELAVLGGMRNVMEQNRNLVIIVECLSHTLARFGVSIEELRERLINSGFSLYDIDKANILAQRI